MNLISKNDSVLVCYSALHFMCRLSGKVACYCLHCLWCSVKMYVEAYRRGIMLELKKKCMLDDEW